ncbi:hypothetical protein DSO57_1002029 [Entomophthora muscae]|uniref:Uncharacterized protein n=1 Tax=Entomophthora muscae TaxID=34485 RepID=A0ACC2SAM1_9FUNG|nr:hypothetical protein DSO57_1002029 [Entomophthora muscae]
MVHTRNSKIYQYFPSSSEGISCIVCRYRYKRDTPMSTLQKHLQAKHCFSVRRPLSQEALVLAMNDASATKLEESIVDWLYCEHLPVSAI